MELSESTQRDFEATGLRGGGGGGGGGGKGGKGPMLNQMPQGHMMMGPPGSCYIKVRGLPYSATQEDIAAFFFAFGVRNEDVSIKVLGGKDRSGAERRTPLA